MSNHIDHIEITNFKSIRHQKIEGCKRINVFIGYPNVGKSAILEAISALSYLQKDYNESYNNLCRYKNSSELFFDGNLNEEATISYSSDIKIVFRFLFYQQLDFAIRVDENSSEYHDNVLVHYNKGEFLKYLIFSENGVESTHKHSESSKFGKLIKGNLLVRKYDFRNLISDHRTNATTLTAPFGENIVDVIQFNKNIRREVSDLFKFYNLKLSIDQETNSIKGLKQLDDDTIFLIPYHQMADTLQRLIFHKAAIMSNRDAVLLFEEPEAHMFPPYISKFTADIIYNKENNNQYFINTHSPFVMNDFLEDAREDLSIYIVGLKNGETVIKRLSDEEMHNVYQYGIDLFFNLERYLD